LIRKVAGPKGSSVAATPPRKGLSIRRLASSIA
jgi:hypothetical protein